MCMATHDDIRAEGRNSWVMLHLAGEEGVRSHKLVLLLEGEKAKGSTFRWGSEGTEEGSYQEKKEVLQMAEDGLRGNVVIVSKYSEIPRFIHTRTWVCTHTRHNSLFCLY